jgi:hypothetical protein
MDGSGSEPTDEFNEWRPGALSLIPSSLHRRVILVVAALPHTCTA